MSHIKDKAMSHIEALRTATLNARKELRAERVRDLMKQVITEPPLAAAKGEAHVDIPVDASEVRGWPVLKPVGDSALEEVVVAARLLGFEVAITSESDYFVRYFLRLSWYRP